MNKTEKLKHIILSKYNSIREFSKVVDIPSTTLNSSLDRGIGGMAVDRMVKICDVLNIDIKTFEPLETITQNTDDYSDEEKNHIEDLRKLNDIGKEKVITYTKDLLDNPKFNKNNNISCTIIDIEPVVEDDGYVPRVFAAHSDGIDEETNRRNIEMIKRLELEKRRKKNNK